MVGLIKKEVSKQSLKKSLFRNKLLIKTVFPEHTDETIPNKHPLAISGNIGFNFFLRAFLCGFSSTKGKTFSGFESYL